MAANGPWTSPTACSRWETRDIVGHLIDVTESYFTGFDAARSGATADVPSDLGAFAVGIRLSGRNARDYLVNVTVDGLSYAQEDVSGLPAVIEFDPGTLVLTAFGRVNAGTIRGDRAVADQFLNSFFRI